MTLKDLTKEAYRHAAAMLERGEIPTFLGINGLLALAYEHIKQYNRSKNRNDLLSMSALCLVCLQLETASDEFEQMEEDNETTSDKEYVKEAKLEATYTGDGLEEEYEEGDPDEEPVIDEHTTVTQPGVPLGQTKNDTTDE